MRYALISVLSLTLILIFVYQERKDTVPSEPSVSAPAEIDSIPDFSRYADIETKKREFFDFMRPIIVSENSRVTEQRALLELLYQKKENGGKLSHSEKRFIEKLIKEYRANRFNSRDVDIWEVLFRRVDVVPVPLALVQAANESAWGTSRFAKLGNNMFGQWCFTEACGIIPNGRMEGETYAVAKFASVNESVRSYIRNINTSYAYREFRDLRSRQREEGEELDSYLLVKGLLKYSTRREEYLKEIRAMLRVNAPLFVYNFGDSSLYAEVYQPADSIIPPDLSSNDTEVEDIPESVEIEEPVIAD